MRVAVVFNPATGGGDTSGRKRDTQQALEAAGPQLVVGHPEADAADGRQQPQAAEQGSAEHVGQEVHAPVQPGGGHQQGQPERQG